ncbi:hypothetical protein X773_34120 [Mesorhizobium sp. LSJC285A00]|nr:hypothetical protein X773_34120 [Mesorhizobium sp. LSJC285A00]
MFAIGGSTDARDQWLVEAGERLLGFTRLTPSQWKAANAIERLHEEFKRRIKTETVLPLPETAAILFWALMVSDKARCEKSMDGRRCPSSLSIRRLTSPNEPQPTGLLRRIPTLFATAPTLH